MTATRLFYQYLSQTKCRKQIIDGFYWYITFEDSIHLTSVQTQTATSPSSHHEAHQGPGACVSVHPWRSCSGSWDGCSPQKPLEGVIEKIPTAAHGGPDKIPEASFFSPRKQFWQRLRRSAVQNEIAGWVILLPRPAEPFSHLFTVMGLGKTPSVCVWAGIYLIMTPN